MCCCSRTPLFPLAHPNSSLCLGSHPALGTSCWDPTHPPNVAFPPLTLFLKLFPAFPIPTWAVSAAGCGQEGPGEAQGGLRLVLEGSWEGLQEVQDLCPVQQLIPWCGLSPGVHQGPSQRSAPQEIPNLWEKRRWEGEGKEELSSGLVPRLLRGLGQQGDLAGRTRNERRVEGWKIRDRFGLKAAASLAPRFYPRGAESGWVLCDRVFLPHCSSRESLWPPRVSVPLPPCREAPHSHVPITSALKILQIREKTVGTLQTWAGTSRERA